MRTLKEFAKSINLKAPTLQKLLEKKGCRRHVEITRKYITGELIPPRKTAKALEKVVRQLGGDLTAAELAGLGEEEKLKDEEKE